MPAYKKEISEISTLRETKGKEQETLERISQLLPNLIESKMWKDVAKMYWESHLVWQHTAMSEQAKPLELRNRRVIEGGALKMMEYAQKALDVIKEHAIEDMLGGAYRFLGRAYTFAGNHVKAKVCYENAISEYSGKTLKSKLEVSGFLADSIIRLGMPNEGLALAQKTYEEFYTSELGKSLKEEDYFTWAVWMSGIAPRVINALLDTDVSIDIPSMKSWLQKVESELKNPNNKMGGSKICI